MRRSVGTGGYGADLRDVTVLDDVRCALCVRLTGLGSLEGVSVAPIGSERGARLLRVPQ